VCYLVGIHKGYDKKSNLNTCTMITKEVIDNLQKWMVEMGLASETEEIKERLKILKSYSSTQKVEPY
jgi:hypothetical protein